MIQVLKESIKSCVAKFYVLLCKIGFCKPKFVCMIDGGICSQMLQYYFGMQVAKDKAVLYDLDFWDRTGGMDCMGNKNRPFELLELFPDLEFERCDSKLAKFYRRYLQVYDSKCVAPAYLNNYRFGVGLENFRDYFSLDKAKCSERVAGVLKMIKDGKSCGVHVRRGDLANNDNPYYGFFSTAYIKDAVCFVKKVDSSVRFFVFSDDVEWVKAHKSEMLLENAVVMEGNKGSEDLIMLANCSYIVASQGTAGRVAALINGGSMLIMQKGDPHNDSYLKAYNNCVLL